jgi:hypothetical protein
MRGFEQGRGDGDDEAVVLRAYCGEMGVALEIGEFISSRQIQMWEWAVG